MKHMLIVQRLAFAWGHEELGGNDDVSIVCARKYEMVRMT